MLKAEIVARNYQKSPNVSVVSTCSWDVCICMSVMWSVRSVLVPFKGQIRELSASCVCLLFQYSLLFYYEIIHRATKNWWFLMSRKLSELFNRNLVIVFFYRRDWCCTQLPARLTLVLTVHFTQNWGSLGSLGSCSASSGLWSNETGAAVTEEIVESAVPGKSRFVLFCFLPSMSASGGSLLAVKISPVVVAALTLSPSAGFWFFRYSKIQFRFFFQKQNWFSEFSIEIGIYTLIHLNICETVDPDEYETIQRPKRPKEVLIEAM